jgi:membrane protease YdiL (CAAX protease family)
VTVVTDLGRDFPLPDRERVRALVSRNIENDPLGETARGPIPFWMFVLIELGLGPLALLLGWGLRQPPLADFTLNLDAFLWGLAASVPMVAVAAAGMRWPVGPIARIKEFLDRELAPILEGCEAPDLALISVAAGVGEEMLFRGVIQGALSRVLGPGLGITLASLLFGLLHPFSPAYMILTALMGAYLGLVWVGSGNLLTVIVAHAVYDFVALMLLVETQWAESDSDG